jgi:prefoldin subunit 5
LAILLVVGWLASAAPAYDNSVINNLKRTREALLSQKSNLEGSADRLGQRIDELQRQLDSVNAYLRDTDRALRDVDQAISSSN